MTVGASTSCRGCGALEARHGYNRWGLCADCAFNAERGRSGPLSDESVAMFLIGRIKSTSKKLEAGIETWRCEAITSLGHNSGFQCGSVAHHERDGRLVCHSHLVKKDIDYILSERKSRTSSHIASILALCEVMPEFRNELKKAIS